MLWIMGNELKRIFVNRKIIPVLSGIVILNMLSVYGELSISSDVISMYTMEITGITIFPIFSIILCMWGYGGTLYEDIKYKHARNVALRYSIKKYVYIKHVSIVFATVLLQFFGQLITVGILKIKFPLITTGEQYIEATGTYAYLAENKALKFVLITAFIYAMWMSVYVLIGQIVSMLTENLFLITVSPILIYYGITNIGYMISIPDAVYPNTVFSMSGIIIMDTPLEGVMYCILYMVLLLFVVGLVSGGFIRKRT